MIINLRYLHTPLFALSKGLIHIQNVFMKRSKLPAWNGLSVDCVASISKNLFMRKNARCLIIAFLLTALLQANNGPTVSSVIIDKIRLYPILHDQNRHLLRVWSE